MDDFIVSARKYRPDNFESVVGQDSITQTLKNSIKTKQVAQAYLFCGPRGVGKTTCARIFAKTINCSNLTSDFEACNQCESCVSFNSLRSLNIYELDAASNNSVDDIRSLIDQVRIPPQIGKFKIYIIDEVHMLSSSAFNAFLKTLEEPPKHVVFILATTEKHKIIPTILSRCQIFDFNRIQIEDIRSRLEFVAEKEGIQAEHDALQIIAQKADGAMRDALSIFDQIVSFAGKTITYQQTIKNLNVLDYDYYFKITNAFLKGDYPQTLIIFDKILFKGFEGSYFISGLASHFRDLLMCKEPGTVDLLEVGKGIKEEYMKYSINCSVAFLFNALDIANDCDLKYKQSQNKRLLIELCLLKITKLSKPETFDLKYEYSSENKASEAQEKSKNPDNHSSTVPVDANKTKDLVEENKATVKPDIIDSQPANRVPEKKSQDNVVKSYSLSKMLENGKTETSQNEFAADTGNKYSDIDNLGIESFDIEKLKYVWTKFAETKRDNDYRMFAYFNQHIPIIEAENKIILVVDNQDMKSQLERTKKEIFEFLATSLNNKTIILDFKLDEQQNKSYIETDEDRLKSMMDKNPEIKNLTNQLNLDFM